MKLLFAFAIVMLMATCALAQQAVPPIPGLSAWEDHMKDNAQMVAAQPEKIDPTNIKENFIWYYDGIFVFHQIAQYTGDKKWLDVAAKCRRFYRDSYIIERRNYEVEGWRNFTRGLYYDWTVLHDEVSKHTAIEMARKGKLSQIVWAQNVRQWDKNVDVSRVVAFCINAWHVARDLGAPEFAGRDPYLDTAYSHLDIWKACLSAYPNAPYPGEQTAKYQPFMFALTAEALIRVYERSDTSQDDKARILAKIYDVARLTYDKLYIDANHAFMSNTAHPTESYKVNLLIVPLYGWLWHVTGEQYFLDAGDRIWKDWLDFGWPQITGWGGKQFSQNYHWSFDYVRWRKMVPEPDLKSLEWKAANSRPAR